MKKAWWILPAVAAVCLGTALEWNMPARILAGAVAVLLIADVVLYLKKKRGTCRA